VNRLTWPLTVVIGLVLGFIVAIFWLIPSSDATSRSALLAVIIAGANASVLYAVAKVQHQGERTDRKVDLLTKQGNGQMAALIKAKTQPDVVSRETTTEEK
jgi:hypothetical protein